MRSVIVSADEEVLLGLSMVPVGRFKVHKILSGLASDLMSRVIRPISRHNRHTNFTSVYQTPHRRLADTAAFDISITISYGMVFIPTTGKDG